MLTIEANSYELSWLDQKLIIYGVLVAIAVLFLVLQRAIRNRRRSRNGLSTAAVSPLSTSFWSEVVHVAERLKGWVGLLILLALIIGSALLYKPAPLP